MKQRAAFFGRDTEAACEKLKRMGRPCAYALPVLRYGVAFGCLLPAGMCVAVAAQGPVDEQVAQVSAALRAGDAASAAQLAAHALQQSPQDMRLFTLEGIAEAQMHQQAAALEAFRSALRISPNYLPALEAAAQMTYKQDAVTAKPYLESILRLQPEDATAHAMLGVADYRARDCDGAVTNFHDAQALLASQPQALFEYGTCLGVTGHYSEAIPVLDQARQLDPSNPLITYNLALDQWRSGSAAEALATITPLTTQADPATDALTLAAEIHEAQGATQPAIDLLRRAIQLHPDEELPYLTFADLSLNHASFQVGVDMLNLGLARRPGDAAFYLYRGVLLCRLGQTAKGIADFTTANRLDPRLSFTGVAEGVAESQAHDLPQAIATFRAQAAAHPGDALTQYLLAEALSEQGAPAGSAEATEELHAAERAVALDPASAQAHDLLATIYLEDNKPSQATAQCNAALKVNPDDQAALYHLILADRRTQNAAEIPGLVKRLMQARDAEKKQQASSAGRSRLVEQVPQK